MKIGYDAKRLFNNHTGLGNYSRAVVDYMIEHYPSDNYHLFTPEIKLPEVKSRYLKKENIDIHTADGSNGVIWRTFGIAKEVKKEKIDIYHGLTHELPRNIGDSASAKVVTIHDLIFKRHPEYFPVIDRKFYHWKCKHALNHADKIVAISQHTKSDIIEFYGIKDDKIEVIYNTCHPRFYNLDGALPASTIHGLPQEYMLSLGSIEPRKNYVSLIKALALIPLDLRKELVIVGRGKTKYVNEIKALIKSSGLEKSVHMRSDISNDQIVELYHRADFFVYPSHYEGHGLPITESLLCGTPVISSETSSMKEAGGPDCLYIAPDDIGSIRDGIIKMTEDQELRKFIAEKGREYASKIFDIKETAERMYGLYKKL